MSKRSDNWPTQQPIDITELATFGEQFPARLMQLGFRLMQVMDEAGRDQYRYVIPPICDVPAGKLLMCNDKQHEPQASDDDLPQVDIDVQAFQIGRYPVTVAEYACAVQAGMVDEPQANDSITWQGQLHHLDRPVVCVTWH